MTISKKRQAELDACGKWVKALRSGRYKQTTGQLKRVKGEIPGDTNDPAEETAYCCLGVACQLAIKEGILDKDKFDPNEGALPPVVQKWLGLSNDEGRYVQSDFSYRVESLVKDNDDNGLNFKEIAAVIEENFMQPKALKL